MIPFPKNYFNRVTLIATWLHGLTGKDTPAGADEFAITDSAAAYAAKKLTLTKLAEKLAGSGLKATAGVLSADLNEVDEVVVDPAVDSIMVIDEGSVGDPTGAESITDFATAIAGEGILATDGVLSLDIDEFGDAEIDVAADTLPFIDESADGDPGKLESVPDFVDKIRGTAATTGITSSGGVLTAAIKIAHLVAGEASSLFFFAKEFDFSGSADLVATKISDHEGASALAAKGTLIAAFVAVTQIADGTTTDVISIAKDGTPTAKLCGDCTITIADCTNKVGSNFMLMPVTGENAIVDPTSEDLYAVAAASANRTAGKVYILLVFQKTA